MLLFQTPLTADQLQHLRKSFAKAKPDSVQTSLFGSLCSEFIAHPVRTGILLFLNFTAFGILLYKLA